MSDYTPTTEEVELYFKQAVPEPYGADLDNAFDRWLAEVRAQAWEEGYNAKWVETYFYDNPYRQGEEQ